MRSTWFLCGWLLCAVSGARASETVPSETGLEGSLLHRRIDLGGLRQWQRDRKTWRPLPPSPAKLFVVNLWSRTCPPCLRELPLFNPLIEQWRGHSEVQFLFIADPPSDTTPAEVVELWSRPLVRLAPGAACLGTPIRLGSENGCVLKLPEVDPVRVEDGRAAIINNPELRPLTLLVDRRGTIRQCFAGALHHRQPDLEDAIRRLLQALAREAQ